VKFGSPGTRQALACNGRSHVGLVREENEDSFGLATDRGIVAVANGMGGHEKGRYVADCAVAALCQVTPAGTLEATMDRAHDALLRTNDEVWHRSQSSRRTMGATLVAAVIDRSRLGIIWAGDSRAYVFRSGMLIPLTRDHSAVQDLLDTGRITAGEAAVHPMRHVVTRALGVTGALDLEIGFHALGPGDIVLLSTDGLHGSVGDDEISRCLDEFGIEALDKLIDIALAAGGRDNVTAVLVEV
jgi:serine/threonine protein phosphatase Stp1